MSYLSVLCRHIIRFHTVWVSSQNEESTVTTVLPPAGSICMQLDGNTVWACLWHSQYFSAMLCIHTRLDLLVCQIWPHWFFWFIINILYFNNAYNIVFGFFIYSKSCCRVLQWVPSGKTVIIIEFVGQDIGGKTFFVLQNIKTISAYSSTYIMHIKKQCLLFWKSKKVNFVSLSQCPTNHSFRHS